MIRDNLVGRTYNGITVIEYDCYRSGKSHWICKCICGKLFSIGGGNLKRGQKSCGCLTNSLIGKGNTIHGMSSKKEYGVWDSMIARCHRINCHAYKDYGARGIKVCARWRKWREGFKNFIHDMGECPKGLSLDRINNNKGYSKSNCKWSTKKEQQNNRRSCIRILYNGEKCTLYRISELTGIKYVTLLARIRRGNKLSKIISKDDLRRTS